MNPAHINLPSKEIQYVHTCAINKTLAQLPLNSQKCRHIVRYIDWLNVHHKFDPEWFQIAESLFREFKLPIIYYLRGGFQRLTSEKNASIVKRFQRQICQIMRVVFSILKQVNPSYTLRNYGLKFFDFPFLNEGNRLLLREQDLKQIKVKHEERILYALVYDFKVITWKCMRTSKYSQTYDELEVKNLTQEIRSPEIDHIYAEMKNRFLHLFNLFDLKFLEDNYQRYRRTKSEFQQFVKARSLYLKPDQTYFQTQKVPPISGRVPIQEEKATQISTQSEHKQSSCQQITIVNKKRYLQQSVNIQTVPTINTFHIPAKDQPINFINDSMTLTTPSNNQSLTQVQQTVYERLCCREYFIQGELVGPETVDVEYKSYGFPWNNNLQLKIGKTICSFLNTSGGNIYVGIQEGEGLTRKVVGLRYSEIEKEQVLKMVRQISQSIRPDIVAGGWYQVSFVPLKTKKTHINRLNTVLKDQYVVKISINQGIASRIYTMKVLNNWQAFFRTQNQVICYKDIHQILQVACQKLNKQVVIKSLYPHENPCDNRKLKLKPKNYHVQQERTGKKALKKTNYQEYPFNDPQNISYYPSNKKKQIFPFLPSQVEMCQHNSEILKPQSINLIRQTPLSGQQSYNKNIPMKMVNESAWSQGASQNIIQRKFLMNFNQGISLPNLSQELNRTQRTSHAMQVKTPAWLKEVPPGPQKK